MEHDQGRFAQRNPLRRKTASLLIVTKESFITEPCAIVDDNRLTSKFQNEFNERCTKNVINKLVHLKLNIYKFVTANGRTSLRVRLSARSCKNMVFSSDSEYDDRRRLKCRI